MTDTPETIALLREIRDNQRLQLERHAEALDLQRRQFEIARVQVERAERLQERAEALQGRAGQSVSYETERVAIHAGFAQKPR